MKNTPSEAQLGIIPKLYETEHITAEDKIVHCHFFIGGCHWFIVDRLLPNQIVQKIPNGLNM